MLRHMLREHFHRSICIFIYTIATSSHHSLLNSKRFLYRSHICYRYRDLVTELCTENKILECVKGFEKLGFLQSFGAMGNV